MKTYDEILEHFVSNDECRPILQKPCLENDDFILACNGHIGIKIPVTKVKETYQENKQFPNLGKIIDEAIKKKFPESFKITIDQIMAALNPLKKVKVYADCPECEGTSYIECSECGNDYKCRECDGTGHAEIIGYDYEIDNSVKIGDNNFNPRYIAVLLKTAAINNSEVSLISNARYNPALFKIDNIDIIISPMRKSYFAAEIKIEENNNGCSNSG